MSMPTIQEAMDTDAGEQPADPYAAPNKNRHYVETPDTFAIARWPRDARCGSGGAWQGAGSRTR